MGWKYHTTSKTVNKRGHYEVIGRSKQTSDHDPLFFIVAAKAELRFSRQKTEQVSNLLLDDLAEDLGTSWRELGTILEIHEKVLEYFDRENECFRDKGIAMLHEWKRLSGNAATVKVLKEALEKIGMSHLLRLDEGTHSHTELIYKRIIKRFRHETMLLSGVCQTSKTGQHNYCTIFVVACCCCFFKSMYVSQLTNQPTIKHFPAVLSYVY